ncbi:MAG: NADH-quinone oxidoreductase subunit C [Mailhella sp.]|nr:NADH-quinone oxidoreductase subunit C [Mailhella sp.]
MMFDHNEAVDFLSLPVLSPDGFSDRIIEACGNGWRLLAMFALQNSSGTTEIVAIVSSRAVQKLDAFRCIPGKEYPSVTPSCLQAHLFERELFESWGIRPAGHPWLKPVRFCPSASDPLGFRPGPAETAYFAAKGSEVHEVAVGPVHAGVIEPGHFRFQCHGEEVLHLEIQLGFQHRGIERLMASASPQRSIRLVENIAGDTCIGHATAYCSLLERLHGISTTRRAAMLRCLALELERLANHTRDLGAIGGDTGFLPTSAWNGRITGDFLNITAEMCGSRFGRNLVCPGGARWDLDSNLSQQLIKRLRSAYRDARGAVDVMLSSGSVLTRLSGTGVVKHDDAIALGLVGVAAKACGIAMDARVDWPDVHVNELDVPIRTHDSGDVLARTLVRSDELDDSAAYAEEVLRYLSSTSGEEGCRVHLPENLPPHTMAVSLVEGWRGEICHVGITSSEGNWLAYKIVDPSYHNWTGLAMALRGEQISDFPLCNKSFNLSYCGHDL